jgi:hypothetical protein
LTQRYKKPAPQLQAFLAKLATEAGVEIPESQDRQSVPHGKKFDERSIPKPAPDVRVPQLGSAIFIELIDQLVVSLL